MLPRLMHWFENAVNGHAAQAAPDTPEELLSSFMADDKLSISDSTITEFSRAIAAFKPQDEQSA